MTTSLGKRSCFEKSEPVEGALGEIKMIGSRGCIRGLYQLVVSECCIREVHLRVVSGATAGGLYLKVAPHGCTRRLHQMVGSEGCVRGFDQWVVSEGCIRIRGMHWRIAAEGCIKGLYQRVASLSGQEVWAWQPFKNKRPLTEQGRKRMYRYLKAFMYYPHVICTSAPSLSAGAANHLPTSPQRCGTRYGPALGVRGEVLEPPISRGKEVHDPSARPQTVSTESSVGNHGECTIEEEPWRRNHRRGVDEKASWRMANGEGIAEEES